MRTRRFAQVALLVALAPSVAVGSPHRPRVAVLEQEPAPRQTTVEPLGAAEVAMLYATVGRRLKALERAKGLDATIDLWPRYRWIRINDAIATADRRLEAARLLERLLAELGTR